MDREYWEQTLDRWLGLSARQWGEDSDAGEPDGPRERAITEVIAALRENREPQLETRIHP